MPAREGSGAGPRAPLRRLAYWSPVGVCMVLFAQVSFLGLRPAVCERRRLADAQAMLETRHARDLELRDAIATNLRARSDPIFLERQRRMRVFGPMHPGASGLPETPEPSGP